ncbi:hypothetical protein JOD18_002628 [Gracilibacillus alcaliphilus]|nr:hypothetical protein [Gracilibacillus alcaliphilus]
MKTDKNEKIPFETVLYIKALGDTATLLAVFLRVAIGRIICHNTHINLRRDYTK